MVIEISPNLVSLEPNVPFADTLPLPTLTVRFPVTAALVTLPPRINGLFVVVNVVVVVPKVIGPVKVCEPVVVKAAPFKLIPAEAVVLRLFKAELLPTVLL